jgi:ADP-heptose:LPS heptosyltransferase
MKISTIKLIDYYVGNLFIVILKPVIFLFGKFLKRDHSLELKKNVTFVKLLGGGSLVIAFPSLLGLRKKYPDLIINIITTKGVSPFARSLNIFDNIFEIDYSGISSLFSSTLKMYFKIFGTDTIIDLEAHSRLTTVLSALTAARNRIGFYLHSAFWKRRIHTHMIFFNMFSGSYEFYDKIVQLYSLSPASADECKEQLMRIIPQIEKTNKYRLCIGHACSDLSKERMLSVKHWESVFHTRLDQSFGGEVVFLGTGKDSELASEIIARLSSFFINAEFVNLCGKTSLIESLSMLCSANEFWGVDSSLNHYARLFKIKCVSFWGPTDPGSYLRNIPGLEEEIVYCKIPCSPCIHITETPPCKGDNVCIQNLFNDEKREWKGLVT